MQVCDRALVNIPDPEFHITRIFEMAFFLIYLSIFDTRSHTEGQTGFKFSVILLQPPGCSVRHLYQIDTKLGSIIKSFSPFRLTFSQKRTDSVSHLKTMYWLQATQKPKKTHQHASLYQSSPSWFLSRTTEVRAYVFAGWYSSLYHTFPRALPSPWMTCICSLIRRHQKESPGDHVEALEICSISINHAQNNLYIHWVKTLGNPGLGRAK